MNFSPIESDIRKFKDLGVLLGRADNHDTAALKRAFALFEIFFDDGSYKFNGAEISNDEAWRIILNRYKSGYLPTTR